VFKLTNISKAFQQTQALNNISLTIEKGEMLALIGPSGSGKTTLLKLLNAQHLPTSGKLTIDDVNIESLSRKSLQQVRQKIAYIPQDLGLVPTLKVFQNILLGK
jgi:ABC-type phosphate/phosphonate transport system ATPase subunit